MQTLANNADARADFTAKVRDHAKGRTLPADFQPKKVIFGILLKDGEQLSCDTLFPFSQVTHACTHCPRAAGAPPGRRRGDRHQR